jgi:phosphoribosylaminoimidazolecarboxamide formyltransferase/IMP cyclohydrolase
MTSSENRLSGKGKVALFSVYNKQRAALFARELVTRGWRILASSGTAKALRESEIPSDDISEIVGEPILGHRVVTLDRRIHAALLAKDTPEDEAELQRIGMPRIDLVYVNFYPLKEEIGRKGSTLSSVVEMTDIGGPAMLRAAAKGRRLAITRESDFTVVLNCLRDGLPSGVMDDQFISALAAIAEDACSKYADISSGFHVNCAGYANALFEAI